MRRILEMLGELALVALGTAGLVGAVEIPTAAAVVLLTLGAILVGFRLLSLGFVGADHAWPEGPAEPAPLRLGAVDYAKALVAWMLGFRRTYAVAPGLYYTGDHHDPEAPLLVTANYHLTVFLLARQVRASGARLLVIDSDGINVWCAASKGRFGNEQIANQVQRYPRELLGSAKRVPLILPKFGMAGVDLRGLRDLGVRPIVGPLYAKDVGDYLAAPPYRHRDQDRVRFGLQSRAFVWLPGVLQIAALAALVATVLWLIGLPWGRPFPLGVIAITAAVAFAYPLLYPALPGQRFAVKGLSLGLLGSLALGLAAGVGWLSVPAAVVAMLFTLATAILMGLEFTGNSAVSNYSRVKREIVRFLPVSALLYGASLVSFILLEVSP